MIPNHYQNHEQSIKKQIICSDQIYLYNNIIHIKYEDNKHIFHIVFETEKG